MKSSKPGSRRKKIITYYLAGVVLPGIIMGYMALRGIRNDQALREKEGQKELQTLSQTFFSEINTELGRFMAQHTSDSIVSSTGNIARSILVLFVRDSTDSKKLISHQLLYLPAELLPEDPGLISSSSSLKEGQRLEFGKQRYSNALKFYQDRILRTSDPEEKKEALVASARLHIRLNQPEKAKATYEKIRKEYKGSLLNGQIPLAIMACLEIMKTNRILGEVSEMRINLQKSLELLLHPDCEYDVNQFEMFFQSFKEIPVEMDDTINSLFTKLEAEQAKTEFLIWFLRDPNLMASSGNKQDKNGRNETFGIPVSSGVLQAMYLSSETNQGQQSGMLIDFPVYLRSFSEKILQKIDPDASINAKIVTIDGDLILSRIITEETGYLTFPFPEYLPKLKLLLSENNPGFMTTLMNARSGIYLFTFLLIVLLMMLGFVFILYTLNVELRLNKLKSEFISNVSHEIKSPLTSIRVMTELLHHKRVENEERKAEYYAAMLEESEHLSYLIDNILDFSRIDEDRKKYEFIDLDPDKLTWEFLKSIREMTRATGFEINYNCPDNVSVIRADRNAILQVLYNLVDNAIKFSGTSRKVDVNLFAKDNEIQLSVKDYGMGIAIKDQEKIFERFYRCRESQQSGIRGSGIGLTIVKKIVEDHEGRISLESRQGEGSLFTVSLPVGGT